MQQLLDGKKYEAEPSIIEFKSIENTSINIIEKEDKSTFTQKVARFLGKQKVLIKIPFIKNFIDKQLNVLPSAKEQKVETNISSSGDSERTSFINELSNNGEYRKLPRIQRKFEKSDRENKKDYINPLTK